MASLHLWSTLMISYTYSVPQSFEFTYIVQSIKSMNPQQVVKRQIADPKGLQIQDRNHYIGLFFQFRHHCLALSREILFLALVLLDKYFTSRPHFQALKPDESPELTRKCVACIWIALKFYGKHQTTLSDIVALQKANSITSQEIIQCESEVLEGIDYQIPLEHTYSSMVRQFNGRGEGVKDSKELAAACLNFYQKAARISKDFILDPRLGPEIVKRIVDKRSSDPRIIQVCRLIRLQKAHQLGMCKPALDIGK